MRPSAFVVSGREQITVIAIPRHSWPGGSKGLPYDDAAIAWSSRERGEWEDGGRNPGLLLVTQAIRELREQDFESGP